MNSKNGKEEELLISFDDRAEPIRLWQDDDEDITPGAHAGEAYTEVDPLVDKYLSNPYDPVLGAMMLGRATGEAIKKTPRSGWMRTLTWFLAIALLIEGFYGILYILDLAPAVLNAENGPSFPFSAIALSGPFLAAGLLLLWRLIRR